MKNARLIIMLILMISCKSNVGNHKGYKTAKDYFPAEKTKVLVVGTFHFHYPGFDAHKTKSDNQIDVLKEPKKSEVTELVEYIKKFQPDKIAIEALPNWGATKKLREYKAGEHRNNKDERYQLAMRIAAEMELDTLYSIDTGSMADDLQHLDSTYVKELFESFDFQSSDPYLGYVKEWIEEEDLLATRIHLLNYFKLINSRESHQYGYGAYLVGDFKLDDNRGADILSVWWYNRNLRIFRKIQTLTESKNERILVIFGNGHAAILRQLIESSPEYEFVAFENL